MNNQYLFNKEYYDFLYSDDYKKYIEKSALGDKHSKEEAKEIEKELASIIQKSNEELSGFTLNTKEGPSSFMPVGTRCVLMKVAYPGLLIGPGNPHSSGKIAEEIKLGFTFDYTTGLPYIPGSTVKGVLRSVFKKAAEKGKEETKSHFDLRRVAYENRIKYLIEVISGISGSNNIDAAKISELEKEIFEGTVNQKGDIFFDAFPVRGGLEGKLFDFDYITPHEDLKNPIPLRLLKVIPDVIFEFKFCINDSKVVPELTAEKKEELYKTIISDFGMGAKTNVGFGVFEVETDPEALGDSKYKAEKKANSSGKACNVKDGGGRKIGKIINLKDTFGFISCVEEAKDIYFNSFSCKDIGFEKLTVGDEVSFTMGTGKNGKPAAKNVRKVGK
ncbi:MAG: type III-B CRISPR module RAMP protein Cmr6 [Butyrivibrio sp.]|nr:type III-B CRISPR module RAMP protein Cmr6 [Butyrivibrio sp.]